jgi:hypothetical protein
MKSIDNIKKIIKDEHFKRKSFFIFYGIFFLVFALLFAFVKPTEDEEKKEEDIVTEKEGIIVKNQDNYSFSHTITYGDFEILIYGSVYNNESIIQKRIGTVEEKYYTYFDETYKMDSSNQYLITQEDIIENFDMKLINPEYLEELLDDSTKKETDTQITYTNTEYSMTFVLTYDEDSVLQHITLTKDDIIIESKYYNEGNVDKFDIEV